MRVAVMRALYPAYLAWRLVRAWVSFYFGWYVLGGFLLTAFTTEDTQVDGLLWTFGPTLCGMLTVLGVEWETAGAWYRRYNPASLSSAEREFGTQESVYAKHAEGVRVDQRLQERMNAIAQGYMYLQPRDAMHLMSTKMRLESWLQKEAPAMDEALRLQMVGTAIAAAVEMSQAEASAKLVFDQMRDVTEQVTPK
jgi:hypothetical protein